MKPEQIYKDDCITVFEDGTFKISHLVPINWSSLRAIMKQQSMIWNMNFIHNIKKALDLELHTALMNSQEPPKKQLLPPTDNDFNLNGFVFH